MADSVPQFLLHMQGISKWFGGVHALDGVDFEIAEGEVVALVGENGAGKSTLMKVLGGIHDPDEGTLEWDGAPITVSGVRAAQKLGIAHIHQELMLAPNLDVAANIFLGRELAGRISGKLDCHSMSKAAGEHLKRIGVTGIRADQRTSELSTGQRQMVEIAKALSMDARVVVMDEPTSSLTLSEVNQLYDVIRELKRHGIAVVYISHRLDEIFEVSDRVVVLRDGKRVETFTTAETNHDEIIAAMVGRELSSWHPTRDYARGKPLLEVNGLSARGSKGPNSFVLHHGEILGFAGLVGAGRTETMEAVFGVSPVLAGAMTLEGEDYRPQNPEAAIRSGVLLVPEDRKLHGLILDTSIQNNITLPGLIAQRRLDPVDRTKERRTAQAEVDRMQIRTPSLEQKTENLSGGNQQKVAIGKWLALTPKVLLVDEPTRGVDVGAKAEIYQHLVNLASDGLGILMVSSDMEEVLGISDRVAVMYEGRIMGIIDEKDAITEENVMTLAAGRRLVS